MSPLRMVAIFSSTKKSVFLCGALFALNFNPDTVQAAITKGPYPQNVTTDAVTIMWETDFWDDQSELTYWQPGDASHVITAIAPAATHEVTFSASQTESNIYEVRLDTGLLEETKGFYHIVSASDVASGTFTTASSTSTNFRFAVYGDSRWGTETHHQILESILHQHSPSNPISFFLHTGDLVSSGLFYGGWHSDFFPAAGVAMSQIPFYPVLGNHELMGGDFLWYYFFFDLPDNGSGTEEESWYSFDYGNAHVIGLDTNMDARDTAYATVGVHDFRPGSKQYDWLIDDLSSARSGDGHRHLFVSLHHPPYSSGRHGVVEATEPISASETNVILNVHAYLVPLFEEYDVDIVFCGHDHLYERSYKNGVHYIVSGGGGAPLYEVDQVLNPYQEYAVSCHQYCIVEVSYDNTTLSAYTKEGVMFDQMNLKGTSSVEEWNRYGEHR